MRIIENLECPSCSLRAKKGAAMNNAKISQPFMSQEDEIFGEAMKQ